MKRHAILVSIGTDGDVYPFLAIGLELQRRGYRSTLATHEHFADHAREAGLGFKPLVSNEETQLLLQQQDFWHPIKGPLVVARWGRDLFRKHCRLVKALASQENPLLVANPGVVAARVVQEELKVPLISVILQPWIIPSIHAPPVMMSGLTLPRWAPKPAGKLYFKLFNFVGAYLIGHEFKGVRESLGLKPIKNIFRWWLSPNLALGLFPDWFGTPQPDWPTQIQLMGFPRNRLSSQALPETLTTFCRQGARPFVVTFGTGMMHAATLFEQTIEACQNLGSRAVVLTKFRSQLLEKLPTFVHHCEFANFGDLFPLCAGVVHHGGIGTVASGLNAGIPQLIFPFAFDQMDNALKVERLGAGTWLKSKRRNSREISSALALIQNPDMMARAQIIAKRFKQIDGIGSAANCIETFCDALAERG